MTHSRGERERQGGRVLAALSHLSGQSDGAGLALGADASGPGGVVSTPGLYPATQVLQVCKLAAIHPRGQLPYMGVEGDVLDGGVPGLQVTWVPWVQGNTVDALVARTVTTPGGASRLLQRSVFSQHFRTDLQISHHRYCFRPKTDRTNFGKGHLKRSRMV